MNEPAELRVTPLLSRGERLLWCGAPRRGLLLRPTDAALIPFSLMWGGFAIFWEWSVMRSGAPFFFRLWGVPFVLAGLYIMIGRFFADARIRANTVYALTNQRVIVSSGLFTSTVKSFAINNISELSVTEKSDRSGTITLGPTPAWWMSSGFNWPGGNRAMAPSLEFVPEVQSVYQQIRAAQLAASGARTA